MANFNERLDGLLKSAVGKGVVDQPAADRLLALAREESQGHGASTLATVFGWIGGGAAAVGVILIVGANWEEIPDAAKLAGFIALFAGAHGTGFWIRKAGLPYGKTAEALHFFAGALFIAGVGLVSQIYNLNGRPPNGVLLWLAAVAPLAVLLSSIPLAALSMFILVLWLHMEGSFSGSPLEMPDTFTAHLMVELGVGVAAIGFASAIKGVEPRVATALRACGTLLLAYSVYVFGFYRHFSEFSSYPDAESAVLPFGLLGLGAVGLALGWRKLAPESPWLRKRLGILLSVTLLVGAAAVAVDTGILPRGPSLETLEFGWTRHTELVELVISVLSWVLWFLLALAAIAWGAKSDRRGYVNAGVAAFGIGVITRFFDLMGSLGQTGMVFLVGGAVLIGTGYGLERWRRKIIRGMQEGAPA